MTRKKIIIITLVVVAILGVAVYIAFRNKSTNSDGTPSSGGGLSSLFPFFGSFGGKTGTPESDDGGNSDGNTPPGKKDALRQISTKIIAAVTVLPKDKNIPTVVHSVTDTEVIDNEDILPTVRFVEKGTGYVYDIKASGNGGQKITDTALVRSAEAYFADMGKVAVIRYIKSDQKTVATFRGTVTENPSGDVGDLKGEFLPDNVLDVSISPDQKSILYLLPTSAGSVAMEIKSDGTGRKQTFTSAFSEWLLDWTRSGVYVTTKASSGIAGYAYKAISANMFEKIIGPIAGLTTKSSPDGKTILYSASNKGGLSLNVRHLASISDIALGLSTFPEKCTWSLDNITAYCAVPNDLPPGEYPDSWYQGIAHFDDGIWKIDTSTGKTTKISDGVGKAIDAVRLVLDENETYLFFVNKNDGTLWTLELVSS